MKLDIGADELRSLLESPSPATMTVMRADGEPVTSPVWFRLHDEAIEFVVAASDAKLEHLRRDPQCVLLIFEAVRPFRGVLVRDRATLSLDDGAQARLAIATRYLGRDHARQYADLDRRPPGWIVRVPVAAGRGWSLADTLPPVVG